MPAATALIATHNHAETLRHSIASVQNQSLQDFELFVVGDGVGDDTRDILSEFLAADGRIRFFDLPKGPRKGEVHRHAALLEARGRIVAYLGDDDLWFTNHLATLDDLLRKVDFGHTLNLSINRNGVLIALAANLENPGFRQRMLSEQFNRFDLTFGGHTLFAYRRLRRGWETTPPEFPFTDLFMWRKFLSEPWCRAASAMVPTGICTATHLRPDMSNRERAEELAVWAQQIKRPEFHAQLALSIIEAFAFESVHYEQRLLALERLGGIGHQKQAARPPVAPGRGRSRP